MWQVYWKSADDAGSADTCGLAFGSSTSTLAFVKREVCLLDVPYSKVAVEP